MRRSADGSSIYETLFDYDQKVKRASEIGQRMAASGFWDDGENAQKLVGELRQLTSSIKPVREMISASCSSSPKRTIRATAKPNSSKPCRQLVRSSTRSSSRPPCPTPAT